MNPRTQIFVKARTSDRKFSLKRKYFTCGELELTPPNANFRPRAYPERQIFVKGQKAPHGVRTSRAAGPLKQRNQAGRLPRHDPRLKPPGSGLHLTAKHQALVIWAFSCLHAQRGKEPIEGLFVLHCAARALLSSANWMLGQLVVQDACAGPESKMS